MTQVKFRLRSLLIATAVTALITELAIKVLIACSETGSPGIIGYAVLVTGLVALVAMRRPIIAFPLIFLIIELEPVYSVHPMYRYCQYDKLAVQGVILAWSIGTPIGWISRRIQRREGRVPPFTRNDAR